MLAAWQTLSDATEARRGLFALPYVSGPTLTSVRACLRLPTLPLFQESVLQHVAYRVR